uniref:Uncharacterized protein n=1 Tax=Anguilla anguilla TaxID=7936 RepID=A0A0E9RHN8_ANGAN
MNVCERTLKRKETGHRHQSLMELEYTSIYAL